LDAFTCPFRWTSAAAEVGEREVVAKAAPDSSSSRSSASFFGIVEQKLPAANVMDTSKALIIPVKRIVVRRPQFVFLLQY